jgi:hypothetical protein
VSTGWRSERIRTSGPCVPRPVALARCRLASWSTPRHDAGRSKRRSDAPALLHQVGFPILIEKDGTGRKLIIAGTLDDRSQIKPEVNLFCEQAPSWVEMPKDTENLPRYFP